MAIAASTNQTGVRVSIPVSEHKSQLDTLRFIAAMAVFLQHVVLHGQYGLGGIGVCLFFVLSGFLICRILILNEGSSLLRLLPAFYGRRFLRIIPVYYLLLLVLAAIGRLPDPGFAFAYLYNFSQFTHDAWYAGTGHFWSLSVEEQFYLLFPIIFLSFTKTLRIPAICLLIASGFLCQIQAMQVSPEKFFLLTPVCGQFLLFGCLAGCIELKTRTRNINGTFIFLSGVALLSLWFLVVQTTHIRLGWDQVEALALSFIVFGLWRTQNHILLSVFRLPPLVYLGRISYGFYLYHLVLYQLITESLAGYPVSDGERSLLVFAATLITAILSWELFEKPINKLKCLFPYENTKQHSEGCLLPI